MPAVRILDNVQLEANSYVIKIKEVDAGTGQIWPGQYMVMDPTGAQVKLPGMHTTEPTFGLPATWVDVAQKEEAAMKGYTVVDAATVLSTHLTELLKSNTAELLSYAEVQKLIKELPKEQGELVKDIVAGADHRVGHPARAAAPARPSASRSATSPPSWKASPTRCRSPAIRSTIAEHVRVRLARQICAQHTTPAGYLPLIALSAKWEQNFAELIVGQGDERSLAMQPSRLSEFITAGPRALRGRRPRGRGAGAGHLAGDPAVRARHRRALPRPDQRAVAVGNPPAGAAEDRRQHLSSLSGATADHAVSTKRERALEPRRHPPTL